jgi:C1A family cysteine protease
MDHQNRKLSYNFQKADNRDYTFSATLDKVNNLELVETKTKLNFLKAEKSVSASSFSISTLPNIMDQGDLGDCVANAFYYTIMSQTKNEVPLSRLYLYANCRCLDYTPLDQDDGTTIRTACTEIVNYGICLESIYPYNIRQYAKLPPLAVYQSAKKPTKFTYLFVKQDLTSIKSALNKYNSPIVFGIMVYSSFMSKNVASNGIVPMPSVKTESLLGGHCVVMVGYNDTTQTFTCANSWGPSWGNKGYFYLPYNYVINPKLASDFCVTTFAY